jgi:hypothetical protein
MRTVSFSQLCAITRAIIEHEPTITDGEWAERIKLRLVRLRLKYLRSYVLTGAMRAVERVLSRQWGPRLVDGVRQQQSTARPVEQRPLSHDEACAALALLHQRGLLTQTLAVKPMPRARVLTQRELERRSVLRQVLA